MRTGCCYVCITFTTYLSCKTSDLPPPCHHSPATGKACSCLALSSFHIYHTRRSFPKAKAIPLSLSVSNFHYFHFPFLHHPIRTGSHSVKHTLTIHSEHITSNKFFACVSLSPSFLVCCYVINVQRSAVLQFYFVHHHQHHSVIFLMHTNDIHFQM